MGLQLCSVLLCMVMALVAGLAFMIVVWILRSVVHYSSCGFLPGIGIGTLYFNYPWAVAEELRRAFDIFDALESDDDKRCIARFRSHLQRLGKWTLMSISAPVVILFMMILLSPAPDFLIEAWSADGADLTWR